MCQLVEEAEGELGALVGGGEKRLERIAAFQEKQESAFREDPEGAEKVSPKDRPDSFDVARGDTVLIKPGVPHRIENAGGTPLKILCACSPPYSHDDTELLL